MAVQSSLCCLLALVGLAASNFVSPGLGKCLDIKAKLKEDGTRQTLEEMQKDDEINVQLYECHGKHNQHFEITGGQFKSNSLTTRCLTAEKAEDNANVHLDECEDGNALQQWELTGDGYIRMAGSEECLDVEALKKDDGSRETWDEIKEHTEVNVHLYKCHDPEKTVRVNQLWSWSPWQNGQQVTEKTEQKWQIQDMGLNSASGYGASALMVVGAASLFAAGALVGRRAKTMAPEQGAEQLVQE